MQTISFVDLEGARRNYRAELEGQSFDSVRAKAEALWNKSLGCMEIEGGTRDILSGAYQNCVEGLCGNEDVGQKSAWYVLTYQAYAAERKTIQQDLHRLLRHHGWWNARNGSEF